MKTLTLIIGVALLAIQPLPAQAQRPARERLSLNADWRFQKSDPSGTEGQLAYEKIKPWVIATGNEFLPQPKPARPAGNLGTDIPYAQKGFDDRGWRQLNLPHDWGIEGPFKQEYPGETGKLPWWGVGWYRKHFQALSSEQGTQFRLEIDGAMAYATVWLNGKFVGGWPYGYASFELDLTPYVEFGADNVIAIRLDNPPDSSRWYPGGGIYRNVWLVKTGPVHVSHWGTYITTPEVTASSATIDLKVTLENNSASRANLTIQSQVFEVGANGKRAPIPAKLFAPTSAEVPAGERATIGSSTLVNGSTSDWTPLISRVAAASGAAAAAPRIAAATSVSIRCAMKSIESISSVLHPKSKIDRRSGDARSSGGASAPGRTRWSSSAHDAAPRTSEPA